MSEIVWDRTKKNWEKEELELSARQGFPDYQCFSAYAMSVLNDIATKDPNVRKVIFNISRKRYVSHILQHDVREELIKYYERENPHLAKLVGDIVPLSMEEHLPLQAADVLCWFLQRTYAGMKDAELQDCHRAINSHGVCGLEISEEQILEIEKACILRAKRKKNEK
jgi:hypothetical protein